MLLSCFSQMAVLVMMLVLNFAFELVYGHKAFLNTALLLIWYFRLWIVFIPCYCKTNFQYYLLEK
jgi:hypothetical protein